MPYMMVKHGDKICVHKQNADKTAGESLHCYTGPSAEAQCKKYMAALYANTEESEGDKKEELSMNNFSFTELQSFGNKPIGITKIDGMAAGDFTSMNGQQVSFPATDLEEYVKRTEAIIESTRTEKGEVVGLPIDPDKHNHEGGAGWIVGLELDKSRNVIRFLVNWTQAGIDLIKGNMRRFFSPSIDPINKIILGGSLTNWPATRLSNTGQILLRPVELSKEIKEIDMPKTLEEMFVDLKATLLEAVGRKPADLQADPAPRMDGSSSPTIQELLQSPDVVEELGRKAQELAADAIRTEKRKLHLVEFASKIAGGTKERPFGLAVRPNEIIAVLLSLPEKQALAVEKLLEKTLDSAVDFAQYGFDADGYIQKPTLPAAIKQYADAWVKSGKPIQEFFAQNPELGDPDNYNLSEFSRKE